MRAFIGLFSFGVDSVAQFVGRRKLRAGMDGRRAGASAAARSGRGARRGRAARSGSAARSIATRVRAGGYVAERGGHFLLADNAGIWKCRCVCLAVCTKRLLRLLRCHGRRRKKQCDGQREYLHNGLHSPVGGAALAPRRAVQGESWAPGPGRRGSSAARCDRQDDSSSRTVLRSASSSPKTSPPGRRQYRKRHSMDPRSASLSALASRLPS